MATFPLPTFLSCLELGYRTTTIPHPRLQLWVSSNEPCQPSQEGRTWGYHEAECALDSGTCPQTCYHQEHQVPGAPSMPLTISMYLFSRVEMPRNWEQIKKKSFFFHLAPCDSNGPLTTLLSAQKLFLPFLLQSWLVNNISTWLSSLMAGTQLTISWDPEMSSHVLCFCPFSPIRFIKHSPYKT